MLGIRSLVVKQGSFLRLFLSQTHLQSFYCILTYNLPTDVLKRRQRAFLGLFLETIRITHRITDSRYTPSVGLMVNNC